MPLQCCACVPSANICFGCNIILTWILYVYLLLCSFLCNLFHYLPTFTTIGEFEDDHWWWQQQQYERAYTTTTTTTCMTTTHAQIHVGSIKTKSIIFIFIYNLIIIHLLCFKLVCIFWHMTLYQRSYQLLWWCNFVCCCFACLCTFHLHTFAITDLVLILHCSHYMTNIFAHTWERTDTHTIS